MAIHWKISNVIMSVFFAFAAYVQHNDPDPGLWIAVYSIPCILSLVQLTVPSLSRYYAYYQFTRLLLILYLTFSISVLYQFVKVSYNSNQYNPLDIEEGRELLGLIIVIIWISISVYYMSSKLPFDVIVSERLKLIITGFSIAPALLWLYYILHRIELC